MTINKETKSLEMPWEKEYGYAQAGYKREYYQRNKETLRGYHRRYNQLHKQQKKAYYLQRRDHFLKYSAPITKDIEIIRGSKRGYIIGTGSMGYACPYSG
jgi:hypothetical protein